MNSYRDSHTHDSILAESARMIESSHACIKAGRVNTLDLRQLLLTTIDCIERSRVTLSDSAETMSHWWYTPE